MIFQETFTFPERVLERKSVRRRGPMNPVAWIVDAETGCWIWQRTKNSYGYGQTWNGQKKVLAHRHQYALKYGPIPDGMYLDHLCRNRACVNPDHLEPITQAANVQRGNRAKITMEIARAIRASDESATALASKHGLTVGSVSKIRNNQTWRDGAAPEGVLERKSDGSTAPREEVRP